MKIFKLKSPTETALDPKTFMPIGIGGSPLLIVTPFEQKLKKEVAEWLDNSMTGRWKLDNDGSSYFIQFEHDPDITNFILRWGHE